MKSDDARVLVSVNVGRDHGLTPGQTLDVYRTAPEAKYLGVIRLMEVAPTRSVGEHVKRRDVIPLPRLMIGDRVVAIDAPQDNKDLEIEKLKRDNKKLLDDLETLKLSTQKLEAELERQRKEGALILDLIKKADARHADAIQETIKLKTDLITAENRAKTSDERAQALAKRLQELELFLAKKAVELPKKIPIKAALNPPAALVKGTIEKVDPKDRTLVSISIGSDVGLARDHTLEVYRLKPKAMYLGVIRIVDVTPQKAVGRLMPTPDGRAIVLQAGDQVTSRFGTEEPKKKD